MNILTSYLGFTGALAAALYGFLTWYERSHMSDGSKETLSLWLMGASKETWTTQFCLLFDSIFCHRHTSLKCISRSVIASLIAVAVLTILLGPVLGLTERMPGEQSFIGVLALGAVINLLPDYASLFQTRWILQKFKTLPSFFGQALVLLLDLLMTGAIIWGGILAYHVIRGIAPPDFFEVIGGFTVYSIFFYSTFLTSIWAWLYCLSSWIMRLFSGKLSSILDVEKRPLQQLALISSLLLAALMLAPRALPGGSLENAICQLPGDQITFHCIRTAPDAETQADYLERLIDDGTINETMAQFERFFKDKKESQALTDVVSRQVAACDMIAAKSCYYAALFSYTGLGTKKSYEKAMSLFDQACSGGDMYACYNLGVLYSSGQGAAQSYEKAVSLYDQACSGGEMKGCYNLGLIYYQGRDGIPAYQDLGLTYFRRACDGGLAHESCENDVVKNRD